MGTGNLTERTGSPTITNDFWNEIRSALLVDNVPRNASGVATDEGGSLGDATYQWLNLRAKNIYLDGTLIDSTTISGKPHRITSASQDSTTKYPDWLTAAGAGNGLSATFSATTTNFIAIINNVTTTVSADTAFSSLTAAPGSNNTCLIDDADLTGAAASKTLGELDSKEITIDNIGSEIDSLDGEIAAFKTSTECFLALVDTSNNKLRPIYRGWAGTARVALSNNDTITLLKLNVLLLKNDGSTKVSSTYYPETVTTSPAAGTAGKVYIERSTEKIGYDTGAAIDYGYMIVGYGICDDSDCVYVEHYDLELGWNSEFSFDFTLKSDWTIKVERGSFVNVNGQKISWFNDMAMTSGADMDSGESLTARTTHYIYVKEDGTAVFSTVAPRRYCPIKRGEYHPLKYFRCVGSVASDEVPKLIMPKSKRKTPEAVRDETVPVGSIVAINGRYYDDGSNTTTGALYTSSDTLKALLSDNWKLCDGSEIYDPESPFFFGSGRYIENLTDDRFLMGDTVAGIAGGATEHTHGIAHVHEWATFEQASNDIFTLQDIDDTLTSISFSGTTPYSFFLAGSSTNATGGAANYFNDTLSADRAFYTTGVLSPPTGAAGATAASGSTDGRPKYLSCFYIRKIK